MNKRILAFVLVMLGLLSGTIANATTKYTDRTLSSGGTLGYCYCRGAMDYYNSATAGQDRAKAQTTSGAEGTLGATAVVWYTDGSGNNRVSTINTASNTTNVITSQVYAPGGSHGYKVTSGHTYRSDEYGTWTKGLSQTF